MRRQDFVFNGTIAEKQEVFQRILEPFCLRYFILTKFLIAAMSGVRLKIHYRSLQVSKSVKSIRCLQDDFSQFLSIFPE